MKISTQFPCCAALSNGTVPRPLPAYTDACDLLAGATFAMQCMHGLRTSVLLFFVGVSCAVPSSAARGDCVIECSFCKG